MKALGFYEIKFEMLVLSNQHICSLVISKWNILMQIIAAIFSLISEVIMKQTKSIVFLCDIYKQKAFKVSK